MAVSAQTTSTHETSVAEAPPEVTPEGLFGRGLRLILSYIRMHPGPFSVSVAGAVLFAFAAR